MRKYYIFTFFLGIVSLISCFSSKPKMYSSTYKITDSLYIDQTEIDVHAWLSYYYWKVQNEGRYQASKVLPDSNAVVPEVWDYIKSRSDNYNGYLSNSTYQPLGFFPEKCEIITDKYKLNSNKNMLCIVLNYPITGLTYEQVIGFCEWRTKIIGESIIEYRLPSEKEWKKAAISGLTIVDKPIGYSDSLLNKNRICRAYNYKVTKTCDHMIAKGQTNAKLEIMGTFNPNEMGIYDTFGNVSEMIIEKGKSKGGNYTKYASQCHPDSIQFYTKPEKWLGFRCVAIRKK